MITKSEVNVDVVNKLYNYTNDKMYDDISSLFTEDFFDHIPDGDIRGTGSLIKILKKHCELFSMKSEIRDMIASGDKVFVATANKGYHNSIVFGVPPTGRELSLTTFEIFRFVEGKIAERWMLHDLLSLAKQVEAKIDNFDINVLAEYDFYSKWSLDSEKLPINNEENKAQGEKNLQTLFKMFQGLGERNYDLLDTAMAKDFQDRHPGIGDVNNRDEYKRGIDYFFESMDMTGGSDIIYSVGDIIINRGTMIGKHKGNFFGVEATNREIKWTTIEIYRIEDDKVRERWAIDDLYLLFKQLGVQLEL